MAKLKPDYIEWVLKLNSTQAQEEYHKLEKANRELKKENDATRKALVDLEKQGKKGSQEWKNLKNSIAQNNRVMSENRAKMQEVSKQFDKSSMTANQLKKRLRELQREFDNTSKATNPNRYRELQREINDTKNALDRVNNSIKMTHKGFISLSGLKTVLTGFFLSIGYNIFGNIIGAFKNAFNIIVEFERENAKLAAILGVTKAEMEDLTKAARQLGATTSYSAAEVTQLQIELAKLGFDKQQIIDMEGAVLKFAKAVGTDLASASAFTGAALRIFGKDASEAETVLASFAIATTKTSLDFYKLQTSLATIGPVAAAAGFSLEDTTALLGQLANAGFDASSAATATRNILLGMADPAGKLAKALGGPAKNAEELAIGLQRLQDAGVDLATALELTDKRSVSAFKTFMEQSGNLIELRDSITGVNDEFNQMADTMGNTVSGSLAALQSASQELILDIAGGTEGPIKDFVDMLTRWVTKGKDVLAWLREHSRFIKVVVTSLVTWKVTQLAVNTVQKAWNSLVKIGNALMLAYKSAIKMATSTKQLFTKATEGATTATKGLNAALKAMPWMTIVSAITTVVMLVKTWISTSKDATNAAKELSEAEQEAAEKAKQHADKRKELEVNIITEKERLLELHKIASDVNASEADRLKAINELNKACPTYNGHLDTERRALVANKAALDDYILSMEKRMRLAYYQDEYKEYLKEQAAAEHEVIKAQRQLRKIQEENAAHPSPLFDGLDEETKKLANGEGYFSTMVEIQKTILDAKKKVVQELKEEAAEAGFSLTELASGETFSSTGGTVSTAPVLPDKKKNKGKGKQIDKIKQATSSAEATHQQNLADIEKNKEFLSDADYAIAKAKEIIRYCSEMHDALSGLRADTKETDTELIDKITKKEGELDQKMAKAAHDIAAAEDSKDRQYHADRLKATETFYNEQERLMKEKVYKQEITQEAADIYLMNQQAAANKEKLAELQRYYDEVAESDFISNQERSKRLEDLRGQIRTTENQVLTDAGIYSAKLRELIENPVSSDGVKQSFARQKEALAQTYEEMMKIAGKGSEEFIALQEERDRRLLMLEYQLRDEIFKIQEQVGLSWSDEYERELLKLKELHAQQLISEKDYQRKRLELGVNNVKRYYDYYLQLSSSMFSAIQDAEISMSDAKYDVLIRQAQNNGEETAGLEEEKENKKLEIQKKYADANFAIKVSEIVANTAVSIMKAFSELGPIGGAIAAALLTATGIAQVAVANAERQKVKNLQPSSSSSTTSQASTNTSTATRALTGFSDGGYTGDGGRYEVAGVVHKGEYVVPKPIMNNPMVVDAVGTIEAIRMQRMGVRGTYADGGIVGGNEGVSGSVGSLDAVGAMLAEMREVASAMKESLSNVRAYLVYQDLEKAKKNIDAARSKFTR